MALMKVKLKLTLFFSVMAALVSCTQETEELRTGELHIPTCTGFNYKDNFNQLRGIIGVPNNKLVSNINSFTLSVYPIPAQNNVKVIINNNSSKKIWLTQAQVSGELNYNLNYLNAPLLVVGGSPLISFNNVTEDQLVIDISFLPQGYYRLYVKVDDQILWENLILN
jgi:hypothetical protein